MSNTARALLSLQATDQRLAARRAAYERLVAQLESRGGLSALREEGEKARARLLELQVEHRRLESEAAALRERQRALEERLYGGSITNVRELTAVESEHSAARRSLAQVEEALAPALAAVVQEQERYDELGGRLEDGEKAWGEAESKLAAGRERLEREIERCVREREEAMKGIRAEDLSLYESLLQRKGGVAVVRVNRRACQGCRVLVPLRELARLRTADGLVLCSSCGRILLAE